MADAAFLLQELRERGLTLATAESCTGGMLGQWITAISGSSDVYKGGVIAYSNEIKARLLSVPQELLDSYGAVSWQVAEAMAAGTRAACRSSVGVGVTGIAGPHSDGTSKPVGLVFVGYSDENITTHIQLNLDGDREEIRQETCRRAIALILEHLK